MTITTGRPLRRVLGLGFGLAFVFGTMVGVAIGLMLLVLIAGSAIRPLANTAANLPLMSMAMPLVPVPAMRAILTAYDR